MYVDHITVQVSVDWVRTGRSGFGCLIALPLNVLRTIHINSQGPFFINLHAPDMDNQNY